MASVVLDPVPYIYSPPYMIFGGVKIEEGFSIIKDLQKLIKEFNDSLEQAYGIRSRVKKFEKPEKVFIESRINPLECVLEDNCHDHYTRNKKTLNIVLNQIKENNINAGVVLDPKDLKHFYFMQLLKEDFEPQITGELLITIQKTILLLSYEEDSTVNGLINEKYITVTTELKRFDYYT